MPSVAQLSRQKTKKPVKDRVQRAEYMDEEHHHTPRPGELARSVQEACTWIGASSSLSAPCSSSQPCISGHPTASAGSARKSRLKRMKRGSGGREFAERRNSVIRRIISNYSITQSAHSRASLALFDHQQLTPRVRVPVRQAGFREEQTLSPNRRRVHANSGVVRTFRSAVTREPGGSCTGRT